MGSEMSDAESFRLVDVVFKAWALRAESFRQPDDADICMLQKKPRLEQVDDQIDGLRRMEDEEACREAAFRIKYRWSAHAGDHDVMSYFSRARDDRLSDLAYVAPLTEKWE